MPSEERYVERDDPIPSADVIVDGSGGRRRPMTVAGDRAGSARQARAAARNASCSAGAAGPRPMARPSSSTTGITSRTDDEVKISSAPMTRSSGNAPSSTGHPSSGAQTKQSRPRLPGENPELERRRQQPVALPPPDVRHRAFQHRPVGIDEEGVVRAALLRLGLRRHVGGVADRFRAGQEPGHDAPRRQQRDEPLPPHARRLDPVGYGADERQPDRIGTRRRPGVQYRRNTASGAAAAPSASRASSSISHRGRGPGARSALRIARAA